MYIYLLYEKMFLFCICVLTIGLAFGQNQKDISHQVSNQTTYPFQNPDMPLEEWDSNIVSMMTLNEKVSFLSERPGVSRLGISSMAHSEGLHYLTQGVPGNWNSRNPISTTTFPQSIRMGETRDPELIILSGEIEGYEARYIFQSFKHKNNRGAIIMRLIIWAPNSNLAHDHRWGRNVNVDMKNTGKWVGDEVAQLYVKNLNSQVSRPIQELKGFQCVHLETGETQESGNSPGRSTSGLLGHQQKRLEGGAQQYRNTFRCFLRRHPLTVYH